MSEVVARIDDYGRPAWIGLMVISFILFWPVGLAVLAFLIWSGRMGCGSGHGGMWSSEGRRERFERKMERMRQRFDAWHGSTGGNGRASGFPSTGNRAFDEYREETLSRLEEEAKDFRSFLDRLRMAKDKAEFDQFMADRRIRSGAGEQRPEENGSPPSPPAA